MRIFRPPAHGVLCWRGVGVVELGVVGSGGAQADSKIRLAQDVCTQHSVQMTVVPHILDSMPVRYRALHSSRSHQLFG